MKKLASIAIGLFLSIISITLFLLIAEGSIRLYDGYIAKNKIAQAEYDWSSRLEGYSIEKPEGIFRTLVLGDSIAYGQGVKRTETFSAVLEWWLNGGEEKRFEVINTGFCGIDTTNELSILLNRNRDVVLTDKSLWMDYPGLAYEPDMVLLQYTVSNDAEYYGPGGWKLTLLTDGGMESGDSTTATTPCLCRKISIGG